MPTPNFCSVPYCLIPLSSDEPIWEWDIVSDSIFLSMGARKALNIAVPPVKMEDFYRLLPTDAARELAARRESVISGKTGSVLECSYICNGFWAHESLMVLSRNSSGRATRVMGRLVTTPLLQNQTGFMSGSGLLHEVGVWVFNVKEGKIWRDRICSSILGYSDDNIYPIESGNSILDVHPSDRHALKRHYELFCKGPYIGENITDLVRARMANGDYAPIYVRGSMVERDADGRGVLIVGVMASSDPGSSAMDSLARDDRLYHALNNMGSGQWNWDTQTDTVHFCSRYLAMLGYPEEYKNDFGKTWCNHIHPDDRDKVCHARNAVIESSEHGDTCECTYRMKRADGGWAWIFDRGCVTWRDAEGRAGHMVGSITNITTAQAERDELEDLVRHDTLTGLRSRAFCNLEIEHIEQNNIRPVSIISVDITGLKMVNDNLGHAMGDEMLTKAASLLRHGFRSTDCIARVGGDEFLVILPNCDNEKGRKLLRKIENSFASYNKNADLPIFAACGLATANSMAETIVQIVEKADEAMYQAKRMQRKEAHAVLKKWIKDRTGKDAGEDDRVE